MTEQNSFSGMHMPCGSKDVAEKTIIDPHTDETKDENVPPTCDQETCMTEMNEAENGVKVIGEKEDTVYGLKRLIESQTELIGSLCSMVQTLSEQVNTLKKQTETTHAECEEIKRATFESRTALAQYIRTNALPHDVLKLLQTENEKMIHKLAIRSQTDILRAVRDLYLEMGNNRRRCEKTGDAGAIKVIDLLMITLQEDIFEEYGVEVLKSTEGVPFKALRMTNDGTVPTTCKEMHMHVASSLTVGFQFEKEVLLKESVALYIYDPALDTLNSSEKESTPVIENSHEGQASPDSDGYYVNETTINTAVVEAHGA